MVGTIDPMYRYEIGVSEFIRLYKQQLRDEYDHLRVVDKRPHSPTVDFLFGNNGYEEHRRLLLMDGKVLPLNFSARNAAQDIA